MAQFTCKLTPDQIIKPDEVTEIVTSRDYLGGKWMDAAKHTLFNEPEVQKYFIPVDGSYYGLFVITIVEPRTIIPEHSHDEAVFRLVLEGSFEVNGRTLSAGDWVIVPKDYKYSIQTRTGYKVLSQYHTNCVECQWHELSKMPLSKL